MGAKDKRIAELEKLLKAALEEIASLKERIAVLENLLGKNYAGTISYSFSRTRTSMTAFAVILV